MVGALIYVLLARALYVRVDENLEAGVRTAMTSLENDQREGQDHEDAARSTAAELSSSEQMLAIYGVDGRLLAEGGRDGDLEIVLPRPEAIPDSDVLFEITEARIPARELSWNPHGRHPSARSGRRARRHRILRRPRH